MNKALLAARILLLLLIIFACYYIADSTRQTAQAPVQKPISESKAELQPVDAAIVAPSITLRPSKVSQGEPVMITVNNLATSSVKEILFDGQSIKFLTYRSKPIAFLAIDLNKKIGRYAVGVKLSNGKTLTGTLTVLARPKLEAPLGIPEKLGGNSTTSQSNLVSVLTKENAAIKILPTAPAASWTQAFQYPIPNPLVTDPFGYSRLTGQYTITHLGTDLRASEGTPVAAMNRGMVTFATTTIVYGNMIIIDHGLGLETLYAHLSKINVTKGQIVERGQIIGLSGQTGYAEQPHLHISVKINGVSIDPVKFLNLF